MRKKGQKPSKLCQVFSIEISILLLLAWVCPLGDMVHRKPTFLPGGGWWIRMVLHCLNTACLYMQSPKIWVDIFLHFSCSSTSMSAIKTVCSVCQFILSVTLLAQVGIIKISWFAWFAHSHWESKTWKGFTVL